MLQEDATLSVADIAKKLNSLQPLVGVGFKNSMMTVLFNVVLLFFFLKK
ncbi:hypothetical protein [Bartonella bacilliformis]